MSDHDPLLSPQPRSPAPKVVLVDDDAAVRAALKFALEIEGYEVEACETGEQLIAMDLPGRDACLLIDYRLEGMSGLDALEALRRLGIELPAILITSYADPLMRVRAAHCRAAVIEKPLLGDGLAARIHALLSV